MANINFGQFHIVYKYLGSKDKTENMKIKFYFIYTKYSCGISRFGVSFIAL